MNRGIIPTIGYLVVNRVMRVLRIVIVRVNIVPTNIVGLRVLQKKISANSMLYWHLIRRKRDKGKCTNTLKDSCWII